MVHVRVVGLYHYHALALTDDFRRSFQNHSTEKNCSCASSVCISGRRDHATQLGRAILVAAFVTVDGRTEPSVDSHLLSDPQAACSWQAEDDTARCLGRTGGGTEHVDGAAITPIYVSCLQHVGRYRFRYRRRWICVTVHMQDTSPLNVSLLTTTHTGYFT